MIKNNSDEDLIQKISKFCIKTKFEYQLNNFKNIPNLSKLDKTIEYFLDMDRIDDARIIPEYLLFEQNNGQGQNEPNLGYTQFLYSECLFRETAKETDSKKKESYLYHAKRHLQRSLELIESHNKSMNVERQSNDIHHVMKRILSDGLFEIIISENMRDATYLEQLRKIYDGSILNSHNNNNNSYSEYLKNLIKEIGKDEMEIKYRIGHIAAIIKTK